MSGHWIEWTIGRGGRIRGKAICREETDAQCRRTCDCEEYTMCDPGKWCPEHLTLEPHCTEGHFRQLMPNGDCNEALFLNDCQDGLEESYQGRDHAMSNSLIVTTWEWKDEMYTWVYADEIPL